MLPCLLSLYNTYILYTCMPVNSLAICIYIYVYMPAKFNCCKIETTVQKQQHFWHSVIWCLEKRLYQGCIYEKHRKVNVYIFMKSNLSAGSYQKMDTATLVGAHNRFLSPRLETAWVFKRLGWGSALAGD